MARFDGPGEATSTEQSPGSVAPVLLVMKPNPFSVQTRISFALPESDLVRIEVFNVSGQRVATLVNETLRAGYHDVAFDSGTLPSGWYVVSSYSPAISAGRRG